MSLKNTPTQFGWISIAVHWLSALAVVGLFAVGLYMVELSYYDPLYHQLPEWHKLVGVVLALFTAWRLGWRVWSPPPGALGEVAWERRVAPLVHWAMLVLLIVALVTGYAITTAEGRPVQVFEWTLLPALMELSPAATDWAGWVHRYGAFALIGLAGLHGLAALKHHVINRDRTLVRMLFSSH